jgi:hypothetical protein
LLHQAKGLIELFLAAADNCYLGAFAGKGQGDGLPDAGPSSRNQGTFSGQACHVLSPPYV